MTLQCEDLFTHFALPKSVEFPQKYETVASVKAMILQKFEANNEILVPLSPPKMGGNRQKSLAKVFILASIGHNFGYSRPTVS